MIANLAGADFTVRETATAELVKLGVKAYPALVKATKHTDREVVRRVEELLEQIRDKIPEEDLEVREHDVVYTAHSKITGRVTATTLKVNTIPSGETVVQLGDLRHIAHPGGHRRGRRGGRRPRPRGPELLP